jgi:hypothetical protein
MKPPRLTFLTLGLLAVLLASACAPAVAASPGAPAPTVSLPMATLAATQPEVQPEVQPEATLDPTETVLPVATSRGPELEATDPTTVALASGGLQLVEFFRFT